MANMKFKVGDRVKIVKNKSFGSRDFVGLIGTINGFGKRNLTNDDAYDIKFDVKTPASGYWWVDEELELVNPSSFTKADLKDGMIVEYRSGKRALFLNDRFSGTGGCMDLDKYANDLTRGTYCVVRTSDGKPAFDIMKVYTVKPNSIGAIQTIFDTANLDLIWERKEESKPAPKYKVGDKVKMRSDLKKNCKYGNLTLWDGDMYDEIKSHDVVTITDLSVVGGLNYEVDKHRFYISDDMIEGLVDYEEMTVEQIEEKLGYKIKVVADK